MTTTSSSSGASSATDRPRRGTVVIGAGQTGLATAYFLARAGQDCLVVHEHERVGDQWRQRYDSLQLNTPAQYDNLPGMKFPAPKHSFPSGLDMADYLEQYAANFDLGVRGRTFVRSVDRLEDGSYRVSCGDTELVADNVVIATGGEHHPKVPTLAEDLDPGIRQLHSHAYRNPSQLLPGPVLVVGAGQSGADLALEVAQAGHETWLSGEIKGEVPVELGSLKARLTLPVLIFLAHHVITMRTWIGRRAQPRIRMGGTPLVRVKARHLEAAGVRLVAQRTTGVDSGKPRLDDGTVLDVANVLWCTGFRQEFGFIHPPVTGQDGWPTDEGGVMTDLPGLYFMGLLFQRGFYSMLIGGAGRDARFIAGRIARRARAHP